MTIKKTFIVLAISCVVLLPATLVFAADAPLDYPYAPPCVGANCQALTNPETAIQDYLVRLYQFAVGISGITAVGMIVWGSVLVATSESITKKQDGREYITSAVIGVLLLFGSYLLLKTINPNIVNLTAIEAPKLLNTSSTDTGSLSCGDPSKIPFADEVFAAIPLSEASKLLPNDAVVTGCKYRRLAVKEGQTLGSAPNGPFYDTRPWGLITKQIWGTDTLYFAPYYKTKDGPSSARCVLYGIRDTKITGSLQYTEAKISKDVKLCLVNPAQEPGEEGATGGAGAAGAGCPPITYDPSTGAPSGGCTPPPADVVQAAKAAAASVSFDSVGTCAPSTKSSANGVISDLTNGTSPLVCYSGCGPAAAPCTQKDGVWPQLSVLNALASLRGLASQQTISVQSLTGGNHLTNSSHYSGNAVDITTSGGAAGYKKLIDALSGKLYAYCEFPDHTMHYDCANANPSWFAGGQGLHVHAQTTAITNVSP